MTDFHNALSSALVVVTPSRDTTGLRPSPLLHVCHAFHRMSPGLGTSPSRIASKSVLVLSLTCVIVRSQSCIAFPEQPPTGMREGTIRLAKACRLRGLDEYPSTVSTMFIAMTGKSSMAVVASTAPHECHATIATNVAQLSSTIVLEPKEGYIGIQQNKYTFYSQV